MTLNTDDVHIAELKPLISPAILMDELPLTATSAKLITSTRKNLTDILNGKDDRLAVIVGPCSIHDPKAAIEYGHLIQGINDQFKDELVIIMRTYFEKPRTTVGWKGLINDPDINDSFNINKGLRMARRILIDLAELGVPTGCEFLDTISPQYVADLVSWGAIGARTTESQIHRELASGLSMPVGFKNGTNGNLQIAIDAIKAASKPHHFLSVTKQGIAAIVKTEGNPDCHIILRGASNGPNYYSENISDTEKKLADNNLAKTIMVDCSHGNSNKNFKMQGTVAVDLCDQISKGTSSISGVMLESNLFEGNQKEPIKYGTSITDACISWEDTLTILKKLSIAVIKRREATL